MADVQRSSLLAAPSSFFLGSRDLRVDLLRGWCVITMIAGHIGGASYLHFFTGADLFYTSAAEGFITISGLVMGLVYRKFVQRHGLRSSVGRALRRAGWLYLLTVSLTLLFMPLSVLLSLPWATTMLTGDPLAFVVSVVTLHQTSTFVDIPLLYTLMVAASPLALLALTRGRPWLVIGGSWLLWAAYQVVPTWAGLPWPIADNAIFTPATWQLFFFHGLVLGWYQGEVTERLTRVSRTAWLAVSGAGTAALLLLFVFADLLPHWRGGSFILAPDQYAALHGALFGKPHMGPGRIVASLVVFTFVYLAVSRWWVPISRASGWLLLPLGQHALYAYVMHILLALPITYLWGMAAIDGTAERLASTLLQLGTILLFWMLIRRHVLFENPVPALARRATELTSPWLPGKRVVSPAPATAD